jgi:uncharacterized protein (TIGR00251 family)
MNWLEARDGGVRIRVRVQPRASRTSVAGEYGDALRIRVASPPVDGQANRELIRFLAETLSVPPSAVRIVHGEAGRNKLIEVTGTTAAAAKQALMT